MAMATLGANELIRAVEQILDPASDPATRQHAHQVYEQFRTLTDVAICIRTGYQIFSLENADVSARFMGMQLLHGCIQQRWQELSDDTILQLRAHALELLCKVPIDSDGAIKHAVSCFIVELIKKIWPQCWPELIDQLYAVVESNETNLDVVMMVLERLSQDVLESDVHLSGQRRQDLKQTLSASCTGGLFEFFSAKLGQHTAAECDTDPVHVYLARRVLVTMAVFLEWCPIKPLYASNYHLLGVLCNLVAVESLRLEAVECLILLAGRKSGSVEDREAILVLFQQKPMEIFLQAASASGLNCTTAGGVSRDSYVFLKRLCTLLTTLGSHQVVPLWGTSEKPGIGEPANFSPYLETLLAFLVHNSFYINGQVVAVLPSFLDHELIKQSPALGMHFAAILSSSMKLLFKPPSPFDRLTQRSIFSTEDFSDMQEFHLFFNKFRSQILEVLRLLTIMLPRDIAELIATSTLSLVELSKGEDEANCSSASPVSTQYDVVHCLVDISVTVFAKLAPLDTPDRGVLLEPLQTLLAWDCTNIHTVRMQQTLIESLVVYVKLQPSLLPIVLQKVFSAVQMDSPFNTMGEEEQLLKLKVSSSFIPICDTCSELIVNQALLEPIFDMLKSQWANSAFRMRQHFIEGLVCASKALPSFSEQQTVVAKVLEPVVAIFQSQSVQQAISSAGEFARYFGIDEAAARATGIEAKALYSTQRGELLFAVHALMAVTRRCKAADASSMTGSNHSITHLGTPLVENPGWLAVQPNLPHMFRLIRVLGEFSGPSAGALLAADFKRAFELPLIDKAHMLGIDVHDPEFLSMAKEDRLSPLQQCVTKLYESSFLFLGLCSHSFGASLYSVPGLVEEFQTTVMHNLLHLPSPYLKLFIPPLGFLLSRLVENCPAEYHQSFLDPILSTFFNVVHERLKVEWEKIERRKGGLPEEDESGGLTEQMERLCQNEVVEDCLARNLLKDIAWFLARTFVDAKEKPQGTAKQANCAEEVEEKTADNNDRLQKHIFSTPALCQPLIAVCLTGVVVPDAPLSVRAAKVLATVLLQTSDQWAADSSSYQQILDPILQATITHGEHPANMSTYVQMLCSLYPIMLGAHGNAVESLLGLLPGATEVNLTALKKSFVAGTKEKVRRDCMRSVMAGVVGKPTSEKHQLFVPESQLPRVEIKGSKSVAEAEASHHTDNILVLPELGLPSLFGPE